MKLILRLAFLLAIILTVPGCLETKQEITLNPDGSGKVVYELKQPLNPLGGISLGDSSNKTSPEDMATKEAQMILDESKGVDVWKDITYQTSNDGKFVFKGTAYFKSFNNLQIGGSSKSDKNITLNQDAKTLSLIWKKTETEGKKKPEQLSEEEISKKTKQTQMEMQQSLKMMELFLKDFKDEVIFHLPGSIDKINNLNKINDNTASLTVNGEEVLKLMKAFVDNADEIEKAIKEGQNVNDQEFLKKYLVGSSNTLFGNDEPPVIRVSGEMSPLFDYHEEVDEAKKDFPAMSKKLGLKAKASVTQ